jgi:hypothetical protein
VRPKRLLVVLLTVLGLSAAGLSSAQASTWHPPQIKSMGAYATESGNPDVVRVTGTYKCWGKSKNMHLWVSVKQGGPDPTAPGSSSTVNAWYDTNISGDVAVICDGRFHTKTVKLGRHPVANYPGDPDGTPPTRPLGYLQNGQAWLQFCLVPVSNESFLASRTRWVTVRHATTPVSF